MTMFELKPMKKEEQKYSFTNSNQISGQTGLIGYLRADMDTDGNGFFSSWTDYRKDIKSQEFMDEFNELIHELRFDDSYNGIIKNRSSLSEYCKGIPETKYGDDVNYYGVRIDTDNWVYLLRLNPKKGEYNVYCYCYVKKWFDEHLRNASRGIRFIETDYTTLFTVPDGGYIEVALPNGMTDKRKCRYVDDYHLEVEGQMYHICEFAEKIEEIGAVCRPIEEDDNA